MDRTQPEACRFKICARADLVKIWWNDVTTAVTHASNWKCTVRRILSNNDGSLVFRSLYLAPLELSKAHNAKHHLSPWTPIMFFKLKIIFVEPDLSLQMVLFWQYRHAGPGQPKLTQKSTAKTAPSVEMNLV